MIHDFDYCFAFSTRTFHLNAACITVQLWAETGDSNAFKYNRLHSFWISIDTYNAQLNTYLKFVYVGYGSGAAKHAGIINEKKRTLTQKKLKRNHYRFYTLDAGYRQSSCVIFQRNHAHILCSVMSASIRKRSLEVLVVRIKRTHL